MANRTVLPGIPEAKGYAFQRGREGQAVCSDPGAATQLAAMRDRSADPARGRHGLQALLREVRLHAASRDVSGSVRLSADGGLSGPPGCADRPDQGRACSGRQGRNPSLVRPHGDRRAKPMDGLPERAHSVLADLPLRRKPGETLEGRT